MTKNILFVEDLPNGWQLYGKTGNGAQRDSHGMKSKLQHGWFIGWVEKGERKILFAAHINDEIVQDTYASLRAKQEVKERLLQLLKQTVHNPYALSVVGKGKSNINYSTMQ